MVVPLDGSKLQSMQRNEHSGDVNSRWLLGSNSDACADAASLAAGSQRRGQEAAALDAAGAGLRSLGLLAFAISFTFLRRENVVEAFFIASIAWLTGVDKRMVA